jgi:hypothetical protein
MRRTGKFSMLGPRPDRPRPPGCVRCRTFRTRKSTAQPIARVATPGASAAQYGLGCARNNKEAPERPRWPIGPSCSAPESVFSQTMSPESTLKACLDPALAAPQAVPG